MFRLPLRALRSTPIRMSTTTIATVFRKTRHPPLPRLTLPAAAAAATAVGTAVPTATEAVPTATEAAPTATEVETTDMVVVVVTDQACTAEVAAPIAHQWQANQLTTPSQIESATPH